MTTMIAVNYHDTCHHRTFRMGCEDFDGLVEFAKRRCQICKLPEMEAKRGRLVIDHDGRYGSFAVRGLLCDKCNSLMRRFDARESRDSRCYSYMRQSWFLRVVHTRRVGQYKKANGR